MGALKRLTHSLIVIYSGPSNAFLKTCWWWIQASEPKKFWQSLEIQSLKLTLHFLWPSSHNMIAIRLPSSGLWPCSESWSGWLEAVIWADVNTSVTRIRHADVNHNLYNWWHHLMVKGYLERRPAWAWELLKSQSHSPTVHWWLSMRSVPTTALAAAWCRCPGSDLRFSYRRSPQTQNTARPGQPSPAKLMSLNVCYLNLTRFLTNFCSARLLYDSLNLNAKKELSFVSVLSNLILMMEWQFCVKSYCSNKINIKQW